MPTDEQTEVEPSARREDPRPTPSDRSRYFLFGEMLLFATISLVASFVLAYDALVLAKDPNAVLSCSINAIFDCAKVGLTWQANVFGFPNAFLGLISEPVVMTIAVAALCRTRFPKWFMFTANIVYFLGVIFAYWLLFQSTFVIRALCPWCLTVTLATTLVFWSMTHWNILEGNFYVSAATQEKLRKFARDGWMTITLMAWIALVVLLEVLKWGFRLF